MTKTKALLAVIAILGLSAGFADWRVFVIGSDVARNQRADTKALCAYRDDIQRRYTGGVAFVRTHPHGILGISAATINLSLTAEASTLKALRPLRC